MKIRILVPLVQVVIAGVLTGGNALRRDSIATPAWTKPEWQFPAGLNAPATVIGVYPLNITYHWLSPYYPLNLAIELIIRFSLIWLLWYSVCIESGGSGLSILAARSRMRRLVDVLAITFGAIVGVAGLIVSGQFLFTYGRLVSTPYLIWAMVITGFYGHDLWVSVWPKHSPAGR